MMPKEIQVLFLDGDPGLLRHIHGLFTDEPYAIIATDRVETAKEVLRKEKIKVIVSDQRINEIQGVHFLREIKQLYPDIIRIIFASYSDFSSAEEAINEGEVYRSISKPFKDAELLSNIRRAMEHFDLIERAELANQRLKAMYEVQREFTSTVSHELRTPLASIKTAIDLVVMGACGEINPEQSEVLGRAKRNVDRLKRLIDDILDLTKMESGKLKMHFMDNDIHKAVKEVVEAQKDVAKNRGLYIKTAFDNGVGMLPFDDDRIIQVINNIIGNALKFTKKGGVTVKTDRRFREGFVLVSVIDTGKGIAEEDLPKLFQKFQQVESAEDNQEGGTGLGLAICKEIIALHGGKIWAESKIDRGTTFNFILPVTDQKESV